MIYHTKAHIPVTNYERNNDRLHRRMERSAKREQAKVEAEKTIEQKEKKHQDELRERRKRQQQEKKERMIAEKENKRRKREEKRLAEEEKIRIEMEENRRLLEEQQAEKERKRIEELHRNEARKLAEEQERKRMMEEKREELEKRRKEVEERLSEIEEERHILLKLKRRLDMEVYQLENKRSSEGLEEDDLLYPPYVTHAEQQTEIAGFDLEELLTENELLKKEVNLQQFSMSLIAGNDKRSKFYTGLPWNVVLHLYQFLLPEVNSSRALDMEDEFFLVLVRLRLGLLLDDLAQRFKISNASVGRIFQKWLEVMYHRLQFLIKWPEREVIRQNMPMAFKQLYPKCVCIIDCSEIFIETPTNFSARSKTYSNYKKNNTVKFLIGITPCGSISFLSECWGGRVSDKVITQESKFLNHIQPGDVILADRGFTIADDIGMYGGRLEIPSFTRGKNQLSQRDVEQSKQLSTVRIHVERVIGHLKKKYTILGGPIPINMLKHKNDMDVSNIDKILFVCGALCNLTKSVV